MYLDVFRSFGYFQRPVDLVVPCSDVAQVAVRSGPMAGACPPEISRQESNEQVMQSFLTSSWVRV